MLTRKDFEIIAAALANARSEVRRDSGAALLFPMEKAIKKIAVELADTNPRFNRDRFLDACGVLTHD